jgi:hypothetical protein
VCVDCSYTCDGTGFCGPNGLALISNGKKKASALIAAAFSYTTASNGFFRINIKDGSKTLMTIIPNTFVDHLDGIQFDDKNEFLFVAAYGTNSIYAYYTCGGRKRTMLFRWDEYVCGRHELSVDSETCTAWREQQER